MLKKVFGTFGARIVCTLITLGIVIINTRVFGSSGVGTIGLFILGITILQILTSFIGGPSLVYMLPRNDSFQLIFLSYAFALFINIIGSILLVTFHLIEKQYFWHLLITSIFFSTYYIHSQIILSQEKIKVYNFLAVLQIALQLGLLLIFIYLLKNKTVFSYIFAYLISFIVVSIVSIPYIVEKLTFKGFKNIWSVFKQMIMYGFVIQIANLTQLLNYRLSYYIIEFCSGRQALGLFELGTKLSEAIWILPKSMATVQYSRISNCNENKVYAQKLTLAFLKLSFVFTLVAVLVLLSIPNHWIAWVFGAEFSDSKPVIIALAFGILVFSCNIILSHYFAGFGKYKINTIASIIGVIITLTLGLSAIEIFKTMPYIKVIVWVGLISTVSYTASFTYTFVCFLKDSRIKLKDLNIRKKDIFLFKEEIKRILTNNKL